MNKDGVFTKGIAVGGTLLVWLPIVAMVAVALLGTLVERGLRFDYLMPAELFPVGFAGGGILLWAAVRARSRRNIIGSGLALMAAFLVGGQVLATISGMASGAVEPDSWIWWLVIGTIAVYTLAQAGVGVGGILLLRDLFRRTASESGRVLP